MGKAMTRKFFHCLHCLKTFPADEAHARVQVDEYEIHGHLERVKTLHDRCCHCGSEWLDELPACVECGLRLPVDGADACQECIDEEEFEWAAKQVKLDKLARITAFLETLKREVA